MRHSCELDHAGAKRLALLAKLQGRQSGHESYQRVPATWSGFWSAEGETIARAWTRFGPGMLRLAACHA